MSNTALRRTRWSAGLIATLLPQDCLLCLEPAGAALLCPACEADLPRLPDERCPLCAIPVPGGEICGTCLKHPPAYDGTVAPLAYAFPADRLVTAFKFGHELALAPALAGWLDAAVAQAAAPLREVHAMVPVPLHPRRLAERGFNQAAEIARVLARRRRLPLLVDVCRRVEDTAAQSTLEAAARQRNVRGAFVCRADLAGKVVAVVDDVMTTGATLDAVARALKARGAQRVVNWVVARTP